MTLKQKCIFCGESTIAKRISGFYLGSNEQIKLWECRSCKAFGLTKQNLEGRLNGFPSIFFGLLNSNNQFF